jgi:hypothetical protein
VCEQAGERGVGGGGGRLAPLVCWCMCEREGEKERGGKGMLRPGEPGARCRRRATGSAGRAGSGWAPRSTDRGPRAGRRLLHTKGGCRTVGATDGVGAGRGLGAGGQRPGAGRRLPHTKGGCRAVGGAGAGGRGPAQVQRVRGPQPEGVGGDEEPRAAQGGGGVGRAADEEAPWKVGTGGRAVASRRKEAK